MTLTAETAKVFKTSSGRRYLTKRAAFRHEALHRLKQKSRHEPQGEYTEWRDQEPYRDVPMHTFEQETLFNRIERRYWRRFSRRVG